MTAKDEAKELVEKYWSIQWQVHKSSKSFKKEGMSWSAAKHCAIIAVETHIYSENDSPFPTMQSWIEDSKHWNEVKQEIEKL